MITINQLVNVENNAKSAKAIITQAKAIASSANKLGNKLHILLLSAVNHAVVHGDTRIIDQVVATVDKSQARGKIVVWLTGLSNLNMTKNKETDQLQFRKPKDAGLTVAFDAMLETSPWEFSVDPAEAQPFDFEKKLAILLNTASKKIKKGDKITGGAEKLSPKLVAFADFAKTQGINVTLN